MATKTEVAVQSTASANSLVPIEKYAILVESPENIRAIVADNLGNGTLSPFDLEQIRIPAGGNTQWERKDSEDPDAQDGIVHRRSIDGIIMSFRDVRGWWEASFEEKQGAGGPPDCQSQDNIHGIGKFAKGSEANPTGLCAQCPKGQWKSDRKGGPGQDCSQSRSLFVIEANGLLPIHIKASAVSRGECRKFFVADLTAKGKPYWSVISHMTLVKDKNHAGIVFSKMKFAKTTLSPERIARLKLIHESLDAVFKNITIDVSDVNTQAATSED